MIEERYEIIKLLGKGRTGGVYEAEDTNLGRKVALRRFFAQSKETNLADYKADFEKVAHSLSALQHPNLLRVYDAGVDDDGAFIISQLLNGVTLHDKIKEGALSTSEVYDLAQQMLDALSTAHSEGFVHGAITPGSILMTSRARGGYLYVILDMGLSRLAPLIQGKDSILSIMADPAILAPELFEGSAASESADLYMFGHILYMSLAGGHPFGGISAAKAGEMHQAGLPPLQNYAPNVPDDFRLWIEKLTQLDPNNRPASAIEALNSLPKLKTPAQPPKTGIHPANPKLNPIFATNTQPPATAGISTSPALGTVTSAGTLSSLIPVQPASPHPAVAGTGLVAGVSGLPVSQPTSSKKPLVIILITSALVTMIIIIMISSSTDTSASKASEDEKNNVTSYRAPNHSGKSYAERNSVAEKIIITHFKSSKPKAENNEWVYVAEDKQKATTDSLSFYTGKAAPHPGIKFPIKSHKYDLFDLGWKLTYIVRPTKDGHKFGFQMDSKLNPGWKGGDISLYLMVEQTDDKKIKISARDSKNNIKNGKVTTVPYKGANSWHTIVIEQEPMDKDGNYSVTVDGKAAFKDTFTNKISFGNWNNHLFSYAKGDDKETEWMIKEIKFETP